MNPMTLWTRTSDAMPAPDGRAHFTDGDPKWHRVGPVEIKGLSE